MSQIETVRIEAANEAAWTPKTKREIRRDRIDKAVERVEADFEDRAKRLLEKHGVDSLWDIPRAEFFAWQRKRAEATRRAHGRDPRSAELLPETRKALRLEEQEENGD